MKKMFSLILFISFLSCDDGDLAIETVDFDSITTVQTCGTVSASEPNLLFKINGSEALILELPAGLLKNEVSTERIESNIPANATLTYRIFSDVVSQEYFCNTIPLTTPSVSEEVIAAEGTIFVTTTAVDDETFNHLIQLSGISFITADGSRITNLQINEFGSVTTSL